MIRSDRLDGRMGMNYSVTTPQEFVRRVIEETTFMANKADCHDREWDNA